MRPRSWTTPRLGFLASAQTHQPLGLAHLPQTAQDDGRLAAKAARLAAAASNEVEREAALAQVVRILAGLGLHYLPDARTTRQLTTGSERGTEPSQPGQG